MSRPRRAPTRRRSAGFTLFEVMAAVLVLGVLYSVLATSAIQGLRSEGESKRRLEASLLADEELAEIEEGIAVGITPVLGPPLEKQIDAYQVVVEVTPFDVSPFLGEDFLESLEEGKESLLAPPENPEESLLRLVSVAVRWLEAGEEYEVQRTTLAYDVETVAGLFPEEGGEAAPAGQPDTSDLVKPDGTPDLERMRSMLESMGGGAR